LYLLDLKNGEQNAEWIVVPVKGQTPGRRYGHTLVFLKPYLILFAGNYGNEAVNDVWIFNSEAQPLQWSKLEISGELPPTRVYHTSAVCNYGFANGMMVTFGGRKKEGLVLNDMWGLRRHRNGTWDWTKAPYKGTPKDRLQHSSLFCGNFFINIGGRSASDGDNLPIEVYDTETSEWHTFLSYKRFRHASFIVETTLYIHGGLEDEKHNNPAKILNELNLFEVFNNNVQILNKLKAYVIEKKKTSSPNSKEGTNDGSKSSSPNSQNSEKTSMGIKTVDKELRLADKAVIASKQNNTEFSEIVRILSVEKLQEETAKKQDLMKLFKTKPLSIDIHEKVLNALLRPREWIEKPFDPELKLDIEVDIILELISRATKVVEEQPIVLRVEAPVKIFGDIHGQYQDLMRFFDLYSAPMEGPGGDIEGLDYIFLGDYVDRGTHSIETMCLLMALKIKYPNQMHLLRGNHEDRWINSAFGFQTECIHRLNEDPDNPIVFNHFNDLFDRLPLAAVVNDTVLCLHGGIGSSISSISDIEKIKRPLEVIHEVNNIDHQLVVDILWSDPTDSDMDIGIQPNSTRDPTGVGNIVKFGPDRVNEFLKNNNLSLILRAHECVMDGFERFAGGQLITIFSATDYCGKHKNAGAIIFLTNKFEIKPYLIYPQDCPNRNWDNSEEVLKLRPPTPPRSRGNQENRKSSFN
jgi:diadenosine tetraphosphatase ApaH/serine/threonine PP2A family protein phosphatase